jgi:2-amino-4-hydroxy-6-hydroxymethyldihydropteridine diphosphokinase
LGRRREIKWGPRSIDIDILLYNNVKLSSESLQIPHPHMQNRRFVLQPLAEIAPNYTHPVLKKTLKSLLLQCEDILPVTPFHP